jgi:protein phosphatase 1 regulatory subunit 37
MHEDTAKGEARKKPKPILKAPKPATQTQRINASLQSGLNALRRDFLGGIISSTPKEGNQTQLNTTANAHNPFWRLALPAVPLPTAAAASDTPNLSMKPLRGVRFTMSSLKVVYPLLEDAPPREESKIRDKINIEHRAAMQSLKNKSWTGQELVKLYEECCRSREEPVLDNIRQALNPSKDSMAPKAIDLTGFQLSTGAAEALSDVLSVDFGLKKLVLENCGLDDEVRAQVAVRNGPN